MAASAVAADAKNYIKTPTGYLMVLRQGQLVIPQIEKIASAEKIPSATFSGLGFVEATFGYWDAKKRIFRPKKLRGELASLNGSIAWKEGKPSIHAHGVVTGRDFKAYGGHILDLVVGTGSVEVSILVNPQRLQRTVDPALGANVLQIPCSGH